MFYVVISILTGVISYVIHTYLNGYDNFSWEMFSYNNPLVVVSSIFLCISFIGIKRKKTKAVIYISKLSKYSLATYLITACGDIRYVIFKPIVYIVDKCEFSLVKVVVLVAYAIGLFIICTFIDYIRKSLFDFIGKVTRLEEKYESISNRCRRAVRL